MPRLAAEWHEQSGVMLTWPHVATDWAPELAAVEACYLQIACQIAARQRLIIVCNDRSLQRKCRKLLRDNGCPSENLIFVDLASNDTWARDYAPLTVVADGFAGLRNFRFNGWGGRYPSELDDAIAVGLASLGCFGSAPFSALDVVLEGGAVETDGEGTLLATRESLLAKSRNPHMSQADIEAVLSQALGLDRFLWLDQGRLSGDDTDGHIDTLARFCDPQTIVYTTALPGDPDAAGLASMQRQLERFKTRQGLPYRLLPLPAIEPKYDAAGQRLPASYANFLIINGAVLLPVYADDADQPAVKCFGDCFPGREIVAIDCRPLIRQKGSLHCCTMQFPKELPLRPI